MQQTMRWYGDHDVVSLRDIKQAGCAGVVTALHHIPVGEVWTIDEIEKRKNIIEAFGMTWEVIESLPVHEDIKKNNEQAPEWIEKYKESLKNVAQCGIKVVTYNFMPILDWLRTNVSYELDDGSKALKFERNAFVVFDLFLLQRPGAEQDYSPKEIKEARKYFVALSEKEKNDLFTNVLLGLPGSDEAFTPDQVIDALRGYADINRRKLRDNLYSFLKEIVPIAEECGLQMAIHPDDPPFSVLGLPRIMNTEQDVFDLLKAIPSEANGLCFCTGSYGARPDNDLVRMIQEFGDHIHFLHLRNTKMDANGDFHEDKHLEGDANMPAIVAEILELMNRKQKSIPMRPDHGHQMLDDLKKDTYPGYSAIGRLKGLAELRGLEEGLIWGMKK